MYQNSDPIGVLVKAVAFAADKHRTQRRKDADASPYINHPIALANVLANEGGITDVVVHWPRATEPYAGDPAHVAAVVGETVAELTRSRS